jgi:FlaA1/EpsC-like NDP-sugar epimerase
VVVAGTAAAVRGVERRLADCERDLVIVGRLAVDVGAMPPRGAWLDQAIATMVRDASPDLAIVSLPAAASDLLAGLRTRFRRLGVPERFFPTLDDLLDGVGPRTLPDIDPATLLDRPSRPLDHDRIRELCRGRRIIVTGAGGSIGSELSRRIADYEPAELVLMDRSEHALFEIDRQIARRHPSLVRRASLQDVADAAGTLRVFESVRPQIVLHAAAHKHVPLSEDHPREAVRNNLIGSMNAVRASIATGVGRFVLISTDKAVVPRSVMGATKRLAEVAVQRAAADAGLACAVVRFGNVLGSSGSVLDIWAREIRDGGPITITDRRMTRYLMTIPEAAGLVLQAATIADVAMPVGRVHVLDMGEPVRIVDLADRFAASHGLATRDVSSGGESGPGEIGIVFTSARPGEKIHEVLAQPGHTLGETTHPAIRTWDGPVPTAASLDRLVRMVNTPAGTDAARAAEAVHAAIRTIDPEVAKEAERVSEMVETPEVEILGLGGAPSGPSAFAPPGESASVRTDIPSNLKPERRDRRSLPHARSSLS